MSARIVRRTQAKRDVAEIVAFLREKNPRVALKFLDAVESAFRLLATMPGIGAPYPLPHPRLARVRCHLVPGFSRHLILYQPKASGVEIVRILHGARNIDRVMEDPES